MPKPPALPGPHGIDLTRPGGVEALLEFHRSIFGDARMEGGDDGGDGGGDGSGAGGDGSGSGGTGDTGNGSSGDGGGQKPAEWDGKIESLPAGVQKIITDLRKEAGDERVATKTLTALQKLLNPDAGDGKPDPEKLTADLTAERTAHQTLQADHAGLQREHQVLLAALDAGADHQALLDSRSFLAKVKDLDPATSDFAAKVTAAVTKALEDNPKLKATQAAAASGTDHSGGSGEDTSKTPMSLDQAVRTHYGTA